MQNYADYRNISVNPVEFHTKGARRERDRAFAELLRSIFERKVLP